MQSVPLHTTPLRLVQPIAIDIAQAMTLLGTEAPSWLGAPVQSIRPGSRRFLTDLSLTIKKAAFVDLGEVRQTPGGCEIEIGWQSSSLAPLFPVFAGRLTLTPTELRLEGFYAPPGGEIGAALDRAFLNIAARGTARWFLERTAEVVGSPRASR